MDRETYFEHLIPLALHLVTVVHDEGPDAIHGALAAIHAIPAPDNADPNTTITILLAAMVNPNQNVGELLDWTRKLLPDQIPGDPAPNPLAVEMGVSGVLPAHALSKPEMHQVVKILLDRGDGTPQILDHLPDADPADIRRTIANIRARKPHTTDSTAA